MVYDIYCLYLYILCHQVVLYFTILYYSNMLKYCTSAGSSEGGRGNISSTCADYLDFLTDVDELTSLTNTDGDKLYFPSVLVYADSCGPRTISRCVGGPT